MFTHTDGEERHTVSPGAHGTALSRSSEFCPGTVGTLVAIAVLSRLPGNTAAPQRPLSATHVTARILKAHLAADFFVILTKTQTIDQNNLAVKSSDIHQISRCVPLWAQARTLTAKHWIHINNWKYR